MLSISLRVLMLVACSIIAYMCVDLGYSYVTVGYGLRPDICIALFAITAGLCAAFKRCMPE